MQLGLKAAVVLAFEHDPVMGVFDAIKTNTDDPDDPPAAPLPAGLPLLLAGLGA